MSDWPGTDARYSFDFKSLIPCGFLIGFTPFGENVYPMWGQNQGNSPWGIPWGSGLEPELETANAESCFIFFNGSKGEFQRGSGVECLSNLDQPSAHLTAV